MKGVVPAAATGMRGDPPDRRPASLRREAAAGSAIGYANAARGLVHAVAF